MLALPFLFLSLYFLLFFFLIKQDQKTWYQQVWSISLEEYIFVAFSERALLHRWKITKTYHATWKQSEIIAETPTSID